MQYFFLELYDKNLKFLYLLAPRFVQNQERMLRTVELCLRLDSPVLPVPLPLPSFPLGDTATSSQPSAKPWLSPSLRSLVEEQKNTVLQEMLLVENVYLIGNIFGFHVSFVNLNPRAVFTL